MLNIDQIRADIAGRCKRCDGTGIAVYGDTTMGRGGYGGQMMTSAVCPECLHDLAPWALGMLLRACDEIEALRAAAPSGDAPSLGSHSRTAGPTDANN